MSDISKCSGNNCPLKKMCKRYTAPSGAWQSYVLPAYEDGNCVNFIPNIQTT